MQKRLLSLLIPALLAPFPSWAVDVLQDADYLAIRVEAEEFDTKDDDRWYLVSDTVDPAIVPDADASHDATANGNAYMEVLPDYRQTGEETDIPPAIWGKSGSGPKIAYNINFPEAGRYVVHVRGLSTGKEDNSVHAGVNNAWPDSGERLQLPCSPKDTWLWSTRKRTADLHCGDPTQPIYIDIPTAGVNTVNFSAREDGFEFDTFYLIKDTSGGTRKCTPTGMMDVSCKNGSWNFADGFVDVSVAITSGESSATVGDTLSFVNLVSNNDENDSASNVELTANLPNGIIFDSADSADCGEADGTVTCDIGSLDAGESKEYELTYQFPTSGTFDYSVTATLDETDDSSSNNVDSREVTVYEPGPRSDIALFASIDKTSIGLGEQISVSMRVSNDGPDDSETVVINTVLPAGVNFVSGSTGCVAGNSVSCAVGALAAGQQRTLSMILSFDSAGQHVIEPTVSATFDQKTSDNSAELALFVSNGVVFEETSGLVAVEAESFGFNQAGDGSTDSGWYLVSDSVQPDDEIYTDPGLSGDASESAYIVALSPMDDTQTLLSSSGPALIYRVFFNTTGTYYLQARAASRGDGGFSAYVTLGGNNIPGFNRVHWCDSSVDWQWSGASEGGDGCEGSQRVAIEITTPGEHAIGFSARNNGLELDKFVLSTDATLALSDSGPEAVGYSDKNVDMSLVVDTDALTMDAGSVANVGFTVTNNNAMAAASDVIIRITDLAGAADEMGEAVGCQVSVGDGANSLNCAVGAMSPGESLTGTIPVSLINSGEYAATVSLVAAQSDDNADNNTHSLQIAVNPETGSASGSSGSGALFALLLGMAGLFAARRKMNVLKH